MKRVSVLVALAVAAALSLVPGTANAASVYSLKLSTTSARTSPVALDGATVSGSIYAFLSPATGVKQVRFYVDNTAATGTPRTTENLAPWDLAGTATSGAANPFNASSLSLGAHTITAAVDKTAGGTDLVTATITVAAPSTYTLQLSTSSARTSPVPLSGASTSGNIYVFVAPATGVKQVRFFVDNPAATGTPRTTENGAPWDLAGTATSGVANPFNASSLSAGTHSVTAAIDKTAGGTDLVTSTFTVAATTTSGMTVSPVSLAMNATPGGPTVNSGLTLTYTGSTAPVWSATTNQTWLSVTPSGTGAATLTVVADPGSLAVGVYSGTVTIAATGFTTLKVTVALTVATAGTCSPVACNLIKVSRPYSLTFSEGGTGIVDKSGLGTGYTTYLRTSTGGGYVPANLALEPTGKGLQVQTTPGGVNTTENAQDNMLGVGFDGTAATVIESSLPSLPTGTGKFEQAGTWFGYSQDEVERIAVVSVAGGWQFEHTLETGGAITSKTTSAVIAIGTTTPVSTRIVTSPTTAKDTAYYKVGTSGTWTALGTVTVPGAFYSFDAAGIDPAIATRSFAGTWATARQATVRPVFTFNGFSLTDGASTPPPASGLSFDRVSFSVPFPTAMVQGPDGRLYVATLSGTIHALTFGADGSVTADQSITTLGSRLALGIAIDPASTPSNVILWVSHSSPSATTGIPNTGTVTRLSGAGFTTRTDVITGLPRSYSNHSVNALHFGADGRLYIAIGGNTGAGAPNTANTEFGTMAEQALSAAVVVADVKAAGFDGTCNPATASDPIGYGAAPCSVSVWADGLRNTYDFVFAADGKMYGTDNGLGVVGSYPPSSKAPCFGDGDTSSYTTGGDNPGSQPDELNLIEAGKYYGHPNPVRDECVFGDGHWQGVAPLSNYTPALANLGMDKSADGITQYRGSAFCGALDKNLIVANYSVGKDLTRVVLSADGRSVVSQTQLASGFSDPLPVTTTSQGWIVVGETGGAGKVTVLKPHETGCYQTDTALPVQLLDSGSATIGQDLYVVGGKTSAAHVNTLYRFNATTDAWTKLTDKPGTAVENPSVVAWNGKLYVAGGASGPFSGAVTETWVYDPVADAWTAGPPLATARAGAGAALVGSTMYVVGGMDNTGASLTSVEKLDLSTFSAWTSAPSLSTPRDNPGVVAIGTTLYAFGGRTRLSNGTEVDGTLATTEALASGASSWVAKASMITGRRTMAAAVVNGKAYLAGGEITPTAGAFPQNEQYDPVTNTWAAMPNLPTPRHGMAVGVLNGQIHLVSGGVVGGTSFSSVHEVFTPPS
ncbi:MAG: PQQ-dependent sugar dehydrogenase [Candidatus Nanopelagicales bacterium]